jgi:hypothetical protein
MHGVFISHKSEDWALAGRIYDYLDGCGLCPFLDVESLHQGNFDEALEKHIQKTPYFLLVLSPNTFANMCEDGWVVREIRAALNSDTTILLVATEDFMWPQDPLPKDIAELSAKHIYFIGRRNFYDIMKRLVTSDIDRTKVAQLLDWRKKITTQKQTFLSSRETVEKHFGTLEARFGVELVNCVKKGEMFKGENRIKAIHMSCYAASLLFAPQINMVDERAFDRGMLFNILTELLKDDEFSVEIIITAPGCAASKDAEEYEKLGNGRLEEYPQAVFLSSYCNISSLIEGDPIFIKAKKDRRFKFMVTDMAMPYALFQIVYKEGYGENDHIKVDLYSEGLTSNMDRRSMVIFRETDAENYAFFEGRYQYTRNLKRSNQLILANHEQWMAEWENLKEESGYED